MPKSIDELDRWKCTLKEIVEGDTSIQLFKPTRGENRIDARKWPNVDKNETPKSKSGNAETICLRQVIWPFAWSSIVKQPLSHISGNC